MMKQIRNLGVMALLAVAIVGCSDSLVDTASSDVAATYDAYDATLLDETLMKTYGEVPSVDEALLDDSTGVDTTRCNRDSLRGGEPGGRGHQGGPGGGRGEGPGGGKGPGGKGPGGEGRDGGRGHGDDHGRDGGIGDIAPLGIRNYRAAAAQLNLTAEQDSLFRLYVAQLRDCASEPAATYRAARATAFAPYKPTIDSICAAVKAGTITRDEAKVQLDSIRAAFEASITALNQQLSSSVASCRATFEAAVESMLTAEQQALWATLK